MRKLFFTLSGLLLFISISSVGQQPKWSKEDAWWESFKNNYLSPRDFRLNKYKDNIKVQLAGNYLPEDTVYADKLISELSGLLDNVKIYRVRNHGNLTLHLNTLPDSVYDPAPKVVPAKKKSVPVVKNKPKARLTIKAILDSIKLDDLMSNKVTLREYYMFGIWDYFIRSSSRSYRDNEKYVSDIRIEVRQSAPQSMRNKAIQYYLTRELVIPIHSSVNIFGQKDNSLLGSLIPLTARFQEKDSFMLSKAYANNIYLQLYIRYPKLFLKSLLYRYGNYTLLLYFIFCILIRF